MVGSDVVDGVPTPRADPVVLAGVAEACAQLRAAGFRLVMVTNQPDIARGKVTAEALTSGYHLAFFVGAALVFLVYRWAINAYDLAARRVLWQTPGTNPLSVLFIATFSGCAGGGCLRAEFDDLALLVREVLRGCCGQLPDGGRRGGGPAAA